MQEEEKGNSINEVGKKPTGKMKIVYNEINGSIGVSMQYIKIKVLYHSLPLSLGKVHLS